MSKVTPAIFLSDLKDEIVPVLEKAWKEFDIEVDMWAPVRTASSLFPHVDYNFLEAPIDCYWNDDYPTEDTGTYFRSQLEITNPTPALDDLNVFFSGNGQRTALGIGSELIINSPEVATHAEIFKIASDPQHARELMREAAMRKNSELDHFANDSSRACKAVLEASESKSSNHLASFCSFVSNPLVAFGESGHLGHAGQNAVARISDIRKGSKPKILVCSMPLSHLGDMRIPMSLFANAVFTAIKMYPHGRAVHAILDEFTALNLPNYHKDVITLRGLGCTAEVYVQGRNALADAMSDKAEATIFDQSDIVSYSAISDFKVASEISAAIGSTSKKGFDANISDRFDDINFGMKEVELPVITPQALMAMPGDMQIIMIRGMRPIKARKLPYWDLAGLREYTSSNPIEGPMPKTKAKAEIKISKDGVKVISPKIPKRFSKYSYTPNSFLRAFNPASFIWLVAWLGIWLNGDVLFAKVSFPALRTHYTYTGSYASPNYRTCRYASLIAENFVLTGGNCPLVMWARGGRRQ